jgi:ribosomal protein S27E
MAKGRFKHRCEDCQHEQYVHWTARARRTRERCTNCGSTRLEPVTKEGQDELKHEGANRTIGPKGSVIADRALDQD